MSKHIRSAAKLLPKPFKPVKRPAPGDVVAVIRKSRDFRKVS